MKRIGFALMLLAVISSSTGGPAGLSEQQPKPSRADPNLSDSPAGPHEVELTWMSIANWYFKLGALRIVMDGYITRLPGSPFFFASRGFPADQFVFTQGPRTVDVASVTRVRDALSANGQLDYLLSGHSHWDHS